MLNEETSKFYECKCVKEKMILEALEATGLGKSALNKSFKEFDIWNNKIKDMKNVATNYYLNFEKVRDSKNNSLALLGESGAGKTHLLIALIHNFVTKKLVKVVYMSYIDSITELKQVVIDGPVYQSKIKKYKNAKVLVIDDLFKNGHTDADLRIMIEIINYRYINNLPIMVSSEYKMKELIEIDKGLGGRIKEMAQQYCYEISGHENNYRVRVFE